MLRTAVMLNSFQHLVEILKQVQDDDKTRKVSK